MLSRVTGLLREVLMANFIGAGPVADAFFFAFRFPNLFRSLFAEGAFNQSFVPIFGQILARDGKAKAKQFADQTFAVLTVVLLIFCALGGGPDAADHRRDRPRFRRYSRPDRPHHRADPHHVSLPAVRVPDLAAVGDVECGRAVRCARGRADPPQYRLRRGPSHRRRRPWQPHHFPRLGRAGVRPGAIPVAGDGLPARRPRHHAGAAADHAGSENALLVRILPHADLRRGHPYSVQCAGEFQHRDLRRPRRGLLDCLCGPDQPVAGRASSARPSASPCCPCWCVTFRPATKPPRCTTRTASDRNLACC